MELHAPRKTHAFTRRTSYLEWHKIYCSIIYWSLILFFCPLQQQCSLHKHLFIDLFWKMVIKETLSYCYYTAEVLWAKRRKTRKWSNIVEDFLISALSLESQSKHVLFVFPFCCPKERVRREDGKAQWTHFFVEKIQTPSNTKYKIIGKIYRGFHSVKWHS